jgi:hypothetical protein
MPVQRLLTRRGCVGGEGSDSCLAMQPLIAPAEAPAEAVLSVDSREREVSHTGLSTPPWPRHGGKASHVEMGTKLNSLCGRVGASPAGRWGDGLAQEQVAKGGGQPGCSASL